ncbi:hypothetical protein I3760_Q008900 [Carya illinoinensis]|nr:hypothetical protein I3760_Q008900 [Carya illinoinensis]
MGITLLLVQTQLVGIAFCFQSFGSAAGKKEKEVFLGKTG